MKIYIKTYIGTERIFQFDVEPSTTIKQLKQLICKKVNINEIDSQKVYFTFDGDTLNIDEETLTSYGVEEQSRLELAESSEDSFRDPGVLGGFGTKFIDVSNTKGLKRCEWAKKASAWRVVRGGLVFEGKCTNSECLANNNMVAISMGYRKFDVVCDIDIAKTVCPICKQYVQPTTCGFNNCWWRFEGIKRDGEGKPPQLCKSDWKQADNAYHYFDQELSGMVTWLRLTLEVVKSIPSR
ncbi:unnamed protein product [Rotaria sp. Silwood2]|nr:unnamed protein product [Rotaria sp. Silwood2]